MSGAVSQSDLDFGSITTLSDAMLARKVSASELLQHTIARIETLDRRLNAVVVRDFDRAREAAKLADAALARGERRPLLGIPVSILGAISLAGRRGIVVRDPSVLELADTCRTMIFDKTGTLTLWQPDVFEVVCAPGHDVRDQVLRIAAALGDRGGHVRNDPWQRVGVVQHAD